MLPAAAGFACKRAYIFGKVRLTRYAKRSEQQHCFPIVLLGEGEVAASPSLSRLNLTPTAAPM